MGRPLKIAKAQAVLTITGTAATGNIVTVSQNLLAPPTGLGIIANMPFVVASNVGGLLAGVDYWVLKVLSAHTFTVSATPLNANPNSVQVTLSNTSAQTVSASVGVVDAYFNNPNGGTGWPATNTATYSVVGGNTAIYGKQVLANVAIGQTGPGQITTANTSNVVFGFLNTFANSTTGSVLQANVANNNGTTYDLTTIGFIGSIPSESKLAITSTVATGSYIVTSGNAQTLANGVVWFDSNVDGNIKANTAYYLGTVTNATHFTVTYNPGGANVPVSSGNVTANVLQQTAILTANASATFSTPVNYVTATAEPGYIVRQKGKQKYLVTGTTTGLTAQCYTANLANTALLPNTMTMTATYANSTAVKVQTLSDHTLGIFTAPSSPDALGNIVSPGQPTGNLGYINTAPAFATFNTAQTSNVANAMPYPLVTITSA